MVESDVIKAVQDYVRALRRQGLRVSRAILFGSYARGDARPNSDIDVLVVAPEFDAPYNHQQISILWRLRAYTDSRIEPIGVGERRWLEDDASTILEIVRREGQDIPVPTVAG
jgi:predicted nucleotidyltransferase